ncbi:putative cysteine-rich receptor-like protein kinase 9, partial [Dichanthelium oligosanthes]
MASLTNVLAVVVLFMPLSCSLLPSAGAATAAELVTWKCDNGTYYAANTTYQSNVRTLLASLATNASRSSFPAGFATAVLGASPDTVWGLGLCRGDTSGADCGSCLALAPEVAFGRCQGVKDVTVFYDRCILRYSFRDFLTSPDNRQVQFRGISSDNVTSNAGWYDVLVVRLVSALSDWAAFNTTPRYAVGVMNSDQGFPASNKDVLHRIIGLVQCTPDQAPAECRRCLKTLIDEMPTVFNGTVGGRLLAVWCHLRFEVHEFYDDSPMLNLVAPQFMPPPPPASTDQQ